MSETSAGLSFEPPNLLESQESAWAPIPNVVYLRWELGISVAFPVLARVESHNLMLQVISSLVIEEVWAPITSDCGVLTLQLQWCSQGICSEIATIRVEARQPNCSLDFARAPWCIFDFLGCCLVCHHCFICALYVLQLSLSVLKTGYRISIMMKPSRVEHTCHPQNLVGRSIRMRNSRLSMVVSQVQGQPEKKWNLVSKPQWNTTREKCI